MFVPAAGRPDPRLRRASGALAGIFAGVLAGCGDAAESPAPGGESADEAGAGVDDPAPGDKPAPAQAEPTAEAGSRAGPAGTGSRIVVAVRRLPATLDPTGDLDPWGQRVVDDLLFSGLTRRTREAVAGAWAVPDLADRCAALADGKTIACRLRPDARFHDDQPVTVDDVVYSVNRWLGNRGVNLLRGSAHHAGPRPRLVARTERPAAPARHEPHERGTAFRARLARPPVHL